MRVTMSVRGALLFAVSSPLSVDGFVHMAPRTRSPRSPFLYSTTEEASVTDHVVVPDATSVSVFDVETKEAPVAVPNDSTTATVTDDDDDDDETVAVVSANESPSTVVAEGGPPSVIVEETPLLEEEDEDELEKAILAETEAVVEGLVDDSCEMDPETLEPADELCVDERKRDKLKRGLLLVVGSTARLVTGRSESSTDVDAESSSSSDDAPLLGEILERGWEKRGDSSALRRNAEVWRFALRCVFKALRPRKLRTAGASEEDVAAAKSAAATFLRDGLLTLGPTFVKLGQVLSTRTDVLPPEYTNVLKTLQDDVPGFSGARAKAIVEKELGQPIDRVFSNFSEKPLAAASLGQVHTAFLKMDDGSTKKVAVKVQRAGLKELFDVDLKNLKKLAELLDRFDPKTDGADRDWVSIYEESERLLYLEIDYLNEADNCERFARDFAEIDYVRVPDVYRDLSTPRVLTMEFVDSFKLTDLDRVDALGLDRELLAKRTADAFLRQIVETGYFHCDPHPGNLCVDEQGNLVYYDFGMMDELRPNVRSGLRKFCTALFAGGPTVNDAVLAKNARALVDGVEEAGVLARGADRLAVEKLARYFMRTFKDAQLGKKKGASIKTTVGNDLQTLTENNVFRFPSTFTFVFRSFASIDGVAKGLDENFNIGRLAQPFIEKFTDSVKYSSRAEKSLDVFSKATGLNLPDISTAVTSPRKIAYVEETLRAMETGALRIRVRSLENEKALERAALTQNRVENLVLASALLNVASLAGERAIASSLGLAGAAFFGLKAFLANAAVKKFDKTQAKFVDATFEDGTDFAENDDDDAKTN